MVTELEVPKLASLGRSQLLSSLAAIDDIRECYRVLQKGGLNIVGEVLRGQGPFYEMDHYPKDDVYDSDTASQYYYHAHRDDHDEHGHFHLFLRNPALPEGLEPALGPTGEDRVAHLVAVSMDAWGYPTDLFAVNRWVTDESWLPAGVIVTALDQFAMDHAYPSWPVNRWLTAMVRCFRPQIEALLHHRDEVVSKWQEEGLEQVLEDRSLEITGTVPIDVESWAEKLEAELQTRTQSGDIHQG
ncbi:hypothetical protein BKP64_14620 [Marinobacter salinus]|uniref:DUF6969 domain-containing protein n=1 Tax=Marinobacter salinus TaxID=1874317 RepID=A0A1D9GP38_9GAMM|nr:hypothetical protein [Marinobacter salinus]AOY89304.1 hypothetical protein BKP64_14620 [Marinobacter salinus]